jgi:8-oxo-dGTP pyrophosphatase MutT (NUDIX family)
MRSAIRATTGGSLQTDVQTPVLQSAHAILLLDGRYILQLRDNKPDIAAPGQWTLFGGMIAGGEIPLQSIQREIFEELSIQPNEFRYLWFSDYFAEFEQEWIRSWFFSADVKDAWPQYKLIEGQDVGIFSYDQIKTLKMPWVIRETIDRYQREMILK